MVPPMHPLLVGLIFFAVLLLCVAGMALGVLNRRKPIQHCGGASLKIRGEVIDCPACAKSACPNNVKGTCQREHDDHDHDEQG